MTMLNTSLYSTQMFSFSGFKVISPMLNLSTYRNLSTSEHQVSYPLFKCAEDSLGLFKEIVGIIHFEKYLHLIITSCISLVFQTD